MNPLTRTRLMLHSHHKAHRLEADVARMSEALDVIAAMAAQRPASMPATDALAHVARLARAALAGATPPDHRLRAIDDRQTASTPQCGSAPEAPRTSPRESAATSPLAERREAVGGDSGDPGACRDDPADRRS
ncbi:hypothetical protein QFZ99_006060 [Paraburkholderia atlantica]|uniref:hypothetical protein n=1 Tax=Paraburkholderia atlantica TaxID=2654982 RepID=UPI003D1D4C9E